MRRTVELPLMGEGQGPMECGGPVLDQRGVQLLDLARPGEAMAMDDLGEERFQVRMPPPEKPVMQTFSCAL